jgi:hypothetical protein
MRCILDTSQPDFAVCALLSLHESFLVGLKLPWGLPLLCCAVVACQTLALSIIPQALAVLLRFSSQTTPLDIPTKQFPSARTGDLHDGITRGSPAHQLGTVFQASTTFSTDLFEVEV